MRHSRRDIPSYGTKPTFSGYQVQVCLPAHNRPSGLNVGSARRRPAPSGGRRSPPLSSGAGLIIRTRPRRGICRPTVGNSPFTRIDRLARSIEDLQAIVRTLGEKAKQKPAHIARNVRKTSARGRFCALQHSCKKRMPVMHLLQLFVAWFAPTYRSPTGHTVRHANTNLRRR